MHLLAPACEAIAATTKKLEKARIVAGYLQSRTPEEAAASCVFLSGRAFPAYEELTLQVGGTQLWRLVAELSDKTDSALTAAYRKLGDLGAVAGEVLPPKKGDQLNIIEVRNAFHAIAQARGTKPKLDLTRALLARATPLEAKYLIKIMTGDLRIGMKESLVEEAIAKACGATTKQVQRANMLLGDIGETCRLAIEGRLGEARMRLFHPIGFMLASPVETAEEAFTFLQNAQIEDKYDGIRAQAHCRNGEVRIFSRTFDDVSGSFPEVVGALSTFSGEFILDGEIVAWKSTTETAEFEEAAEKFVAHALPFSELQKRLGRKLVTPEIMRRVPVAYVTFDILYSDGLLVIDCPLQERGRMLDAVFQRTRNPATVRVVNAQGALLFEPAAESPDTTDSEIIRAPVLRARSVAEVERFFELAQARGNEGLMIKDFDSPYSPGRRGQSWLKLKRELATLDVVVTSVEYGHGRRINVLSDYTFAVRDGERFVNIGKAYSGLTDKEITTMTAWFLAHTLDDQGFRRKVEPKIVLEVAFNAIMRSERHESGYALRFPRILRIREDKLPEEIDTLQRVQEIYGRQHGRS